MFLTRALNIVWRSRKAVKGRLHGGKNPKEVHLKMSWKQKAVKWMIMEQQNVELLDNPYVTWKEEGVYGKDHGLKEIKQRAYYEKVLKHNKKPFKPDMTLVDHYEHLNTTKKWE